MAAEVEVFEAVIPSIADADCEVLGGEGRAGDDWADRVWAEELRTPGSVVSEFGSSAVVATPFTEGTTVVVDG